MGAFLFYLLKSGCCLVVFYIFFKLLMSRSIFPFQPHHFVGWVVRMYFASTYRADNYRGDFFAYSVVCHSRDIAKYGVCHSKSGTDGRSYSYI